MLEPLQEQVFFLEESNVQIQEQLKLCLSKLAALENFKYALSINASHDDDDNVTIQEEVTTSENPYDAAFSPPECMNPVHVFYG